MRYCGVIPKTIIMKYPTTKIIFDRKKQATKKDKAPVSIEIYFGRRRKYISTGVKLYSNQWDDVRMVKNSMDMINLNKRIKAMKGEIDDWILSLMEKGEPFDWGAFERFMERSEHSGTNFMDFAADMIATRTDIRESTRKTQRKLITALEDFGKIVEFSDLTKANVMAFDDYLHARGIRQTSVYSYHKFLKTYVNEAIRRELIDKSPYLGLRLKRGESEDGRFLTEDELKAMRGAELPSDTLKRVRDLFVLQCLTGLSYSDLMDFDFSKVDLRDGQHVLSECRNKTGVSYTVVLLPEVMEILGRYGNELPKISNQQYNLRLKVVAQAAGVDKPIASHWGRRTCGMYLLNKGFPMEIVAKVLGHKSIKTTEAVYAKILDKSVEDAFRKLGDLK